MPLNQEKSLFLVYINKIGVNYAGDSLYEFLFSETKDVNGEHWDNTPANSMPEPPENIGSVKILKTSIKFDLAQESTSFGMRDVQDGVLALGWELFENDDEDAEFKKRLVFKFGDTQEIVNAKLYERDIVLKDIDKIAHY